MSLNGSHVSHFVCFFVFLGMGIDRIECDVIDVMLEKRSGTSATPWRSFLRPGFMRYIEDSFKLKKCVDELCCCLSTPLQLNPRTA